MVRRLLSSIVIAAAAISVGSTATTENVVESSKVHPKKDVHQKVQDDVDKSSTKVEALSTTPNAEKKLNNVESESKVDDNTATVPTTESPWTSFDIPLPSTKNFYKIDQSSSDDGKWSTIANAQVCHKFGTSSIHVTLSKYKKKNRSLMINYRSDVLMILPQLRVIIGILL